MDLFSPTMKITNNQTRFYAGTAPDQNTEQTKQTEQKNASRLFAGNTSVSNPLETQTFLGHGPEVADPGCANESGHG